MLTGKTCYMVVVCGHNYSNAIFFDPKSAQLHADVLNANHRDERGMWVVVESKIMQEPV